MPMKDASNRKLRGCARALMLSLLAASQPFAQQADQTVARLKDVNGNVLVSRESGLASGDESLRLAKGTRVITTAHSEVVIAYDNGCEVKLKENQRFEVVTGKPCAALIAQAESILMEPAGAATAATVGGLAAYGALLPALGNGLVGLAAIDGLRGGQKVSPS
jgi:hypothetical protein